MIVFLFSSDTPLIVELLIYTSDRIMILGFAKNIIEDLFKE